MYKCYCRLLLFISFFSFFVISGCKKETVVLYTSFNYFPTGIGKWTEYSVDSVFHSEDDNNNDDSVYRYHFQIREEIDSAYTDDAGRVNQVIKRYRRTDSTYSWKLTDVWTQTVSNIGAYRTEDNISYHKLSFPYSTQAIWNGNDVNTFDEELYSYQYIHQPATVNMLQFDSTVSVIQIDENNFVEKLYGNEKYASGIGLIFRERDELGKRNGIVVKGLEYKMQITGFGN